MRVNISAVYEIVNVVTARSGVKDVNEHLYRTLQIAVRQTLGKRTLEEVLAEKTDIDETVSAEVRREMEAYGVRVGAIALKDIILPGDIRDILNQVVTAEKQAQANLIRRREETAATRSLLNTAKLMEDNPLLVRLKELETLEKIADKVEKITVVGGLEGAARAHHQRGAGRGSAPPAFPTFEATADGREVRAQCRNLIECRLAEPLQRSPAHRDAASTQRRQTAPIALPKRTPLRRRAPEQPIPPPGGRFLREVKCSCSRPCFNCPQKLTGCHGSNTVDLTSAEVADVVRDDEVRLTRCRELQQKVIVGICQRRT